MTIGWAFPPLFFAVKVAYRRGYGLKGLFANTLGAESRFFDFLAQKSRMVTV